MKKIFYTFLVILLLVLCLIFFLPKKEKNDNMNSIKIAEVTHSVFYAPLYVAIEEGYFNEENIDIKLILTPGADKVSAAVLSGDVQIGFAGAESAIYVYEKNEKDYLQIFSGLTKRDGQFILGRKDKKGDFTLSHKIILLAFAIAIGVIVWGVLEKGFWIPEIAAVFLAVGVISGILGKLSPDEMANAFIEGAKEMIGPAIMIGFARGIIVIAENANIIDTILYNLSSAIGSLPSLLAAYVMYPIQMFINFFINSGSGQAALTMPILAPLGDLVGISRQLTVLIYQLGDGFSNAMFPTSGVLIACLGIAGVPYGKWLKWIIPLQIILFALSIGFITIASLIGWA